MGQLHAAVLGVVQGVSEFLPISSDGHLIIVPGLLGWQRFGLGFDVMLHAGTLLATVLYFWRDLGRLARGLFTRGQTYARDRRLAWLILGATVPSVVVALALDGFVEGVGARPMAQQITIAAWGLLGTAALLAASEILAGVLKRRKREATEASRLGWGAALGVGVAQGFAALPGLSRSGATIAAGQALGMEREEAARFSFLLSVPIIAAATSKKLLDVVSGEGAMPPVGTTLTGVAVTAVVGYAAIWFLLPFVRKHSLWWFAAYTAVAGILLLARYALV